MATLTDIEGKAKKYSVARAGLQEAVAFLQLDLEQSKRRALPRIKKLVAEAKQAAAALKDAIEESPELFEKPRTQVMHGIKLGFQKQKGKIEWDDDERVVALIRKHFPDQFDVLVRTVYEPVKTALSGLSVADLKKIAVEATDSGDAVLIKDTVADVDKLVKALLKEDEEAAS